MLLIVKCRKWEGGGPHRSLMVAGPWRALMEELLKPYRTLPKEAVVKYTSVANIAIDDFAEGFITFIIWPDGRDTGPCW